MKLSLTSVLEKASIEIPAFIGGMLLRLLHATWRVEVRGPGLTPDFWKAHESIILVFWHNRQLMAPLSYRRLGSRHGRRPMHVLISQHRDGRIIAQAMRYFGIDSVAGSSTRGGAKALRNLIRRIRAGSHISITPDGPRGPVYGFKPGTLELAQLSGAPIVLLALSARRSWQFGSWDRMILPKPFTRVVIEVSAPLKCQRTDSEQEFEKHRSRLESEFRIMTDSLDEYALA